MTVGVTVSVNGYRNLCARIAWFRRGIREGGGVRCWYSSVLGGNSRCGDEGLDVGVVVVGRGYGVGMGLDGDCMLSSTGKEQAYQHQHTLGVGSTRSFLP